MVDAVNGSGPISTLLRAQNSTLTSLNNSQQAAQKLFDIIANGAKPTTVQQGDKSAGVGGKVPRGSLVDILA